VEDEELVALAQRETGRATAGLGDADHALALLEEARVLFDALGEALEVRATDLATAEVLQDLGRLDDASPLLDRLMRDAGGVTSLGATGCRLYARQQALHGDLDEARSVLESGLDLAERAADRLELALILELLGALEESGEGLQTSTSERADEILASIGVIRVAS
jgi:tetratricopeptide (TPR) repeat protein